MKRTSLYRRLTAAMLLLLALCLSGCGGEQAQNLTDTTPESAAAVPGSSVEPGGETTPAGQTEPAEPSAAPEYTTDAAGKIASVSVGTPEEWNRFARDFNAERERFAESLDVFIETQLSFAGTAFVALTETFSGRIHGPEREKENVFEKLSANITAEPEPDSGAGFRHIYAIEGSLSLFGDTVGDLTLENLDFLDIDYSLRIENSVYGASSPGIRCYEAQSIALENVVCSECRLGRKYTDGKEKQPNYLLASYITQSLKLNQTLVRQCNSESENDYGGLLFVVTSGRVMLSEVYVVECAAKRNAVLAGSIRGRAFFREIGIYGCKLYTDLHRPAVLFEHADNIGALRDITVENSLFTRKITGAEAAGWKDSYGVLFFEEDKFRTKLAAENVTFVHSAFSAGEKAFDQCSIPGILIKDCYTVPDDRLDQSYAEWPHGQISD